MTPFTGLVLLAVLLTGISHVFLKIGSRKGCETESFHSAYLNISTMTGYGIFLIVTFISVIALFEVPLKTFYAISSLNFVVITLLSWGLLKEKINKGMIIGLLLVVAGVAIFNL